MNGLISQFGERFWMHVLQHKPEIGQLIKHAGRVSSVEYQDRYLFGPLGVRLLVELLRPLSAGGYPEVRIKTLEGRWPPASSPAVHIAHDWEVAEHRDHVLTGALMRIGMQPMLMCQRRNELPHERRLTITWSGGGAVTMYLDQGMGHWTAEGRISFDFTARPADQMENLLSASFTVGSRGRHPMLVFAIDASL